MNALIIEDEALTATLLEDLLHQYDKQIFVLKILPSVKATIDFFRNNLNPRVDLIFMDIHLEDNLCFNIFEEISLNIPVIFTTAYDEYMLKAFKVNSVDYLLKPLDYNDLSKAIDKFKSLQKQNISPQLETLFEYLNLNKVPKTDAFKTRFFITLGTKIHSIESSDIAYFTSEGKTTNLVTKTGLKLPVEFSLEQLAGGIVDPKVFFRVSRQHILSISAIKNIQVFSKTSLKVEVEPKENQGIYVSRDRVADFKTWLGK